MAYDTRQTNRQNRNENNSQKLGITTAGGYAGKELITQTEKDIGLVKKGQSGAPYYSGYNWAGGENFQKGAFNTLVTTKTNTPVAGYNKTFKKEGYIGQYLVPRIIGNDMYGKLVNTTWNPQTAQGLKADKIAREQLIIQKEGKQDFVDETNKLDQITAEDVLKKRLMTLKYRGRVSMPSPGTQGNEPTLNISGSGVTGLNFT